MKMKTKVTPTKREIAQYKALIDVGLTANAVAVRLERDPKTVRKYLRSDVYRDPEITAMVDKIKKKEIAYLYFLGSKSRQQQRERFTDGGAARASFT
jgi:predicted transcriptional regulator